MFKPILLSFLAITVSGCAHYDGVSYHHGAIYDPYPPIYGGVTFYNPPTVIVTKPYRHNYYWNNIEKRHHRWHHRH